MQITKQKQPVIPQPFLIPNQLATLAVHGSHTRQNKPSLSHKQTAEQLTSLQPHTGHSARFHIATKTTVTVQRYLSAKLRRPAAGSRVRPQVSRDRRRRGRPSPTGGRRAGEGRAEPCKRAPREAGRRGAGTGGAVDARPGRARGLGRRATRRATRRLTATRPPSPSRARVRRTARPAHREPAPPGRAVPPRGGCREM